jgi:hypothetical protein
MIFILLYQLFKLTTRLSHLEVMIEELSEEIAVKEQMLKKDDH